MPSPPQDRTAFPSSLSSSFNSAAISNEVALASVRSARALKSMSRNTSGRIMHKRSRTNLRAGDPSSTIPIRGMEAPVKPSHGRLASSAPSTSTFSSLHYPREPTPSPAGAMAKMTAGGFRPRQTPARSLINAAKAAKQAEDALKEEQKRARDESTTPVPSRGLGGLVDRLVTTPPGMADPGKGKRVKV
jgi:hypothetical protein